jgi:hypothetical protein
VRRRSPCLAATDWSIVKHNHRAAFAGEQVRCSHAGDAGADNADVSLNVNVKPRRLLHVSRRPGRIGSSGILLHTFMRSENTSALFHLVNG